MKFTETRLQGAYLIEIEPIQDFRGFFARGFCQKEFLQQGLNFQIVQCNITQNPKRGTLRGLHYQIAPYEEAKLVSCVQGAIYDVVIDLRPTSPTYGHWVGTQLSQEDFMMLYVPKGFAHGYQTLRDGTVVFYRVSEFYQPVSERGIRWDDPAFKITWSEKERPILSEKDRTWADFNLSQPD